MKRIFNHILIGWPGQLVVRVRERGIASAQEAIRPAPDIDHHYTFLK